MSLRSPRGGVATVSTEAWELQPGGVREVPLDRAGVGHRLDALVFGRQVGGQSSREVTDFAESVRKCGTLGDARRRQCARIHVDSLGDWKTFRPRVGWYSE